MPGATYSNDSEQAFTTSKEDVVMPVETSEKYCPICGKEVMEPSFKRFGEWACSETHAEEYVKEVRAQKVQVMTSASQEEQQGPPRRMCCGG